MTVELDLDNDGAIDIVRGGTGGTTASAARDALGVTAEISAVDLQQTYDNSSSPLITTTTAKGAVTIKRGSAADTDNVVAVKNGAGTTKAYVTGEGVVHTERLSQTECLHGFGGFQDQSVTIATSDVNVWTWITNATNNLWVQVEDSGVAMSGDLITIANTGHYSGVLTMSISGTNAKDFRIRIYNTTQAVQHGYYVTVTTTGASNYQAIPLPLYIDAVAGDVLRFEIACATDGSDPIVKSAVYHITYQHD